MWHARGSDGILKRHGYQANSCGMFSISPVLFLRLAASPLGLPQVCLCACVGEVPAVRAEIGVRVQPEEALLFDKGTRGFSDHLNAHEKLKHAFFVQRLEEMQGGDGPATILDELTDDDVCMLMETEEEVCTRWPCVSLFLLPPLSL